MTALVNFMFGRWGMPAMIIVGLVFLFGAWKVDRWAYGRKQFKSGGQKVRVETKRNANANIKKARRVRDRALRADPKRLRPSPYVRRR